MTEEKLPTVANIEPQVRGQGSLVGLSADIVSSHFWVTPVLYTDIDGPQRSKEKRLRTLCTEARK